MPAACSCSNCSRQPAAQKDDVSPSHSRETAGSGSTSDIHHDPEQYDPEATRIWSPLAATAVSALFRERDTEKPH